ncbi:MAG: DUF6429 family protein [Pseudomonadota bacterium]
MDYNEDAVDDATLALMFLTLTHGETATWKGYDWETTQRLHEKGFLENPRTRNKSIGITEEGVARCKKLFIEMFGSS